jgi:hypothetical protein
MSPAQVFSRRNTQTGLIKRDWVDSRTRLRATFRTVALLAFLAVFLVGSSGLVSTLRANAIADAANEHSIARSTFETANQNATNTLAAATAKITAAREALTGSAGKVLSEETRTALTSEIHRSIMKVAAARAQLSQSETRAAVTTPDVSFFSPGGGLRADARTIAALQLGTVSELNSSLDALLPTQQAVVAATAAWKAEQDRLAAVAAAEAAAAAAEAAAQAAADAAARAPSGASTTRSSNSASPGQSEPAALYDNYVWGIGWQAEIDACLGSVDVTNQYRTPTLVEHWTCGGSRFPTRAGTLITLSGMYSGTWRVEGIVARLSFYTPHFVTFVPHDYELLYQTCANDDLNNEILIGLTRVG